MADIVDFGGAGVLISRNNGGLEFSPGTKTSATTPVVGVSSVVPVSLPMSQETGASISSI